MAFLEVSDLHLHYSSPRGLVSAVDGMSFSLEKGQALGIVGESGSGKSSLALALTRLLPRNVSKFDGRVSLNGEDLMTLGGDEFRRRIRWRQVSLVVQGAMNSLNPVLRVGGQIAEAMERDRISKREMKDRTASLLNLVGLPEGTDRRYPHQLSGGMKQRVVIAMALALYPSLVIMDEPTSALDVTIQAQITNLLKSLKRDMGLSFIWITHDIALASDLCDRLAVVYGGQIVEQGSLEQVLLSPTHPYTQLLLASIPRLRPGPPSSAGQDDALKFIPGTPPDLASPPAGCRFHPRCPHRIEPCDHQPPPPNFLLNEGHLSACWLYRRSPIAGPAEGAD